jgi:hypothetical protein
MNIHVYTMFNSVDIYIYVHTMFNSVVVYTCAYYV